MTKAKSHDHDLLNVYHDYDIHLGDQEGHF